MSELERQLEAVGPMFFPATPDLAGAARARLPARRPRRWARPVLAAGFAAAALAAGVLALSPGARSAILDLLDRVPGIRIERVESLPLVDYVSTPYYGIEMGLDEAEQRFGRSLMLPQGVGRPSRVHWLQYPPGDMITAVYGDDRRARLVFSQWKTGGPDLFYKTIGMSNVAEAVTVAGAPGVWISGGAHVVWFHGPGDRESHYSSVGHLAGNVLAWRRGDVIYRLEADVPKARALALARSLEAR